MKVEFGPKHVAEFFRKIRLVQYANTIFEDRFLTTMSIRFSLRDFQLVLRPI